MSNFSLNDGPVMVTTKFVKARKVKLQTHTTVMPRNFAELPISVPVRRKNARIPFVHHFEFDGYALFSKYSSRRQALLNLQFEFPGTFVCAQRAMRICLIVGLGKPDVAVVGSAGLGSSAR